MAKFIQGTIEQLKDYNEGKKITSLKPIEIEIREVPVEVVKEIETIIEKPVIQYVQQEVQVEKIVEKQIIQYVDKIIEVIKEVPVEVIKEVKVLDKELLQKEVAHINAKIEELNDIVLMPQEKYNDSELRNEISKLKNLNLKLMIILGMIGILALTGVIF